MTEDLTISKEEFWTLVVLGSACILVFLAMKWYSHKYCSPIFEGFRIVKYTCGWFRRP